MSTWKFSREKNDVSSGDLTTNPSAGLLAGSQPFSEADALRSKRNVILTNKGWVRRQIKASAGATRIIDEVLVAAHPGAGNQLSYASNTYAGNPDISQLYLSAANYSTIANNATVNCYAVFNEPVKHSGLAGTLLLKFSEVVSTRVLTLDQAVSANVGEYASNANTVANSVVAVAVSSNTDVTLRDISGSYTTGTVVNFLFANGTSTGVTANVASIATASDIDILYPTMIGTALASNSNTGIVVANNTVVFSFSATPTGRYKVHSQTVINATSTAANLCSLNSGSVSANLVITGAVSNTLGTFTVI